MSLSVELEAAASLPPAASASSSSFSFSSSPPLASSSSSVSVSAGAARLLSLRLRLNAGRRENARSAKEEMERLAGNTPSTRTTRSTHNQQQVGHSTEHAEASSGGPVGQSQRAEPVDAAILPLLHDPADTADIRWKEQKVRQSRRKGYASDEVDEDEERKEGRADESGRRRVRELSSHNVFDPQTAHRQYERNLLHAQQQRRIHAHRQQSAADSPSTSTSSTSDPYVDRAAPSSTAVDRLVADMDAAAKRRAAFSRRRRFNDEEDVSYINERNRTFNKKVARAFDAYTIDIAQSLERGTAL